MNGSKRGWLALVTLALVLAGLLPVASAAAAPCVTVTPDGARRCYSTIQAAVDVAPDGATINIGPGTYVEQVTIYNKTLTVYGNGATVRAPSTTRATVTYGELTRPAIIGVVYSNVDIRNLTVDGANSLERNPGLFGIAFQNSNGSVKETVVKNVGFGQPRAPRESGYPEGTGIAAGVWEEDSESGPYSVTIAGNTISNYNIYGIYVLGGWGNPEGTSQLSAVVRNNRVVGSGPTDQSRQIGISFFGNGRIEQNTVSNHFFTGTIFDIPDTCGIQVRTFSGNQIIGNTLVNNEIGICADGRYPDRPVPVVLDGNRVSGPAAGASGYTGVRLRFEERNTVELRNTAFSNLATGLLSWPGSTITQSGNTFSGVTTPVRIEE